MIIYRPLGKWEQPAVTPRPSTFKASWDRTIEQLQSETDLLTDSEWQTEIVIEVDVPEGDITAHDRLHARAQPRSPRVAVSFESRHGPLRYECGTYETWRDNVRGVTLGLNALRAVARYGIGSRGEQYTGWKALGTGIALGAASMTVDEAAVHLHSVGGHEWPNTTWQLVRDDPRCARFLWRTCSRLTHPDSGGDAAAFDRVSKAYDLITTHQGATP